MGSQSCNRRDGAGREVEGKELDGVTLKLSKKKKNVLSTVTLHNLISSDIESPASLQKVMEGCLLQTDSEFSKVSTETFYAFARHASLLHLPILLPSLHRFAVFTETPLFRSSLSAR